ncbi:hypothetical protein O6P37_15080 [Mycobacterium sp. CPCC 205372]|uniref:ESX-1 secretion-associated protein EspA/EspE-like domain-containing protein n=1 Tax=Mycobacterium hippophais TaxID=3016340 RepID=A0ABT4PUI6_9MYCO|nr:hypothetical protein [Mycobacterium hippophais]MCZ8380195.1 hypothetical protein [Mycobacterium hippophais]
MAALIQPPEPSAASPAVAPVQPGPALDPASIIAAQEHGLAEYLNRPVQEILAQLGYPPFPPPPATVPPNAEPPPPPAGAPLDPGALIKPVTDALGTLGTGMFEALDPTQMFSGIAKAVDSSSSTVAPALNGLGGNWEGAGADAATVKTAAALRNGEQVAAQATDIRNSVATATAAVKQAEVRLLEIIARFQATVSAIGPNIIFPWGQATLIAAATEAVTRATETMTELQAMLAGESASVSRAGAPVAVTEAPQAGSDMMSQLVGALSKGAQSGVQTATDMASSLGGAAADSPASAMAGAAPASAPLSKAGGSSAGTSGGMGGGGGGGGGANTLSARSAPPMPAVSEDVARTTPAGGARPGGSGAGMYPPGMMGAPMAGAQGGRPGGGDHNPADFLHTAENGREIVGDLGTAAPPVLGETEAPKVQKRAT